MKEKQHTTARWRGRARARGRAHAPAARARPLLSRVLPFPHTRSPFSRTAFATSSSSESTRSVSPPPRTDEPGTAPRAAAALPAPEGGVAAPVAICLSVCVRVWREGRVWARAREKARRDVFPFVFRLSSLFFRDAEPRSLCKKGRGESPCTNKNIG